MQYRGRRARGRAIAAREEQWLGGDMPVAGVSARRAREALRRESPTV